MGAVIVVGSVNVDFSVRVDRLPGPGETVTGGTFERQGGGKGANQALAAARVGASVRLVAAVGTDELGRTALDELEAAGVDVSGCLRLDTEATGIAVIVVDRHGENQIAVASGANGRLDGAAVEAALSGVDGQDGDVLLAGFEVSDAAVLAAATWAAARGVRLVLNPAPARALPAEIRALHPILTPNAAEAMALASMHDAEHAAHALHALTDASVIVTLGQGGALLLDDGIATRYPALPVTAVDSTGAGDVLNGILCAELARGAELEAALRFAMAGATLSTQGRGARGALPDRSQIEAALRRHR